MRDEPAARLVARVEHRALEAQLPEFGEESEIGLLVGEHHADEGDVARQPAQRLAQTIERRGVHGELDGVDAHRSQRPRAREQRVFIVGRIAERRARLASSRDSGDRLARGIERDGAERAPPRIFQIDDVGPKLHDNVRLGGVDDTGEHARHRVPFLCGRQKSARRARGDAEGRQQRRSRELQRLDWPQAQSYHCAREETQMHAGARAVLAIAIVASLAPQAVAQFKERPIRTGPASRSRRRLFRSPPSGPALRSISTLRAGATKATSRIWRRKWRSGAVPIADVESAIADFKAKAGPDANAKLLARLRRGVRRICRSNARKSSTAWIEFGRKQTRFGRSHPRGERGGSKIFGPEEDGQARPAPTVKSGCYGTFAFSTIAVRPSLTSARRRR